MRGKILLIVLTMIGGLLAGTLPAQAEDPGFDDACPGFRYATDEAIWGSDGYIIGFVTIGIKEEPGLACVATFKQRWTDQDSRTIARLDVIYTSTVESRWDDGDYQYFAGDDCQNPRPAQCSTRYARGGQKIRFSGDMAPPGHPGSRFSASRELTWAQLVRLAG